jgi:ABC-type nitrate/sulfonate/bicarbonate transport system permease component
MLWLARETLRTEEMYASLVVIATLGVAMNGGLQQARAKVGPWLAEMER